MIVYNIWVILGLFFVPVLFKQLLFWLYLWQNREYRFDRMWDFLGRPESTKVIFDKWTLIRALILTFYILAIYLSLESDTISLIVFFAIVQSALETMEFIFNIGRKKNIKRPKFSPKIAVNLFINALTLSVLSYLIVINFLMRMNVILSLLVVLILAIPLITGFWLLALYPLDLYFKNQLFTKVKSHRKKFKNLKVLAVSGAFGKSSSKEILAQILSTKLNVLKTEKYQNVSIAVAKKTYQISKETQFFIAELGSYRIGEGRQICEFIMPNMAMITGLNFQHFSLFGSEQNIIKAESESLQFLKKGQSVFVNYSSLLCREVEIDKSLKVVRYGVVENIKEVGKYDIYAQNAKYGEHKTTFELVYKGKITKLETNLLGKGSLENLVGSIAVALSQGLKVEEFKSLLKNLQLPQGSLIPSKKDWGIAIDDSHNANFDGVKNALKQLQSYSSKYKKIVVIDDILELGDKSISTHKEISQLLLESKLDIVVLVGKNFAKIIQDDMMENGFDKNRLWLAQGDDLTKVKIILNDLIQTGQSKKVVLYEGSRSSKLL
jgi:UDP-N-acetylmuramoyl-tripeptide--D-alanyl-D-alanine ligase